MKPTYKGDCYIETAKCYFSLPEEEWGNCRMRYNDENTFGFVLSNKYILGLYKYCREARRNFVADQTKQETNVSVKVNQLMEMKDVRVLANCLLLDDVKLSHKQVFANLYTIFILE